jgi:hypothetical protein
MDARDILEQPERQLRLLCAALDVEFTTKMLSWPAGPRETDGIWAKYWYDAVLKSTSFQPYVPRDDPIPKGLTGLVEEAEEIYRQLYQYRVGER